MRPFRIYMLAVAVSLLTGSIAQAGGVEQPADKRETKAVYEGLDDKGRVVRLTTSDLHVETFERLPESSRGGHAAPHWSSLFGTGAAAEAERAP
jgi:hypothetical protein